MNCAGRRSFSVRCRVTRRILSLLQANYSNPLSLKLPLPAINIRGLSDKERAEIEKLARADNRTASGWVRNLIIEALGLNGKKRKK